MRLWGTDTINGKIICRCWNKGCCGVAGKHPVRSLKSSVIRSEADLKKWIIEGGNLGLSLHFNKPGAPTNPLRIVAFDDDDGTARKWLEDRGITSPWIVLGVRGSHVYALMPPGAPDLLTKYNALKPSTPKLDVKVSGLMGLPMDNGKTLEIDGEPVTMESMHLLDRFNSLEALSNWLPKVDPRTVIPGMRERGKDAGEAPTVKPFTLESVGPIEQEVKQRKMILKVVLQHSNVRPPDGSYNPNYSGIPYHERKRYAKNHAKVSLPSIPGKKPFCRLLKIVTDCILHYGMSDLTTSEIIRDCFNPRCRYNDGRRYPWKESSVAAAIEIAHREGSYSTLANLKGLADSTNVKARLKKKGVDANMRRDARVFSKNKSIDFLFASATEELGYVATANEFNGVIPRNHLTDGTTSFKDLYENVKSILAKQHVIAPKENAFGRWLGRLGLKTYRGVILTKSVCEPLPQRVA